MKRILSPFVINYQKDFALDTIIKEIGYLPNWSSEESFETHIPIIFG
jgi:hypothetical protein